MEAAQRWVTAAPLMVAMFIVVGSVPFSFAAIHLARKRMPLWSWFAMIAVECIVLAIFHRILGQGLSTLMEILSAP